MPIGLLLLFKLRNLYFRVYFRNILLSLFLSLTYHLNLVTHCLFMFIQGYQAANVLVQFAMEWRVHSA